MRFKSKLYIVRHDIDFCCGTDEDILFSVNNFKADRTTETLLSQVINYSVFLVVDESE